jgi:hypothetical protein
MDKSHLVTTLEKYYLNGIVEKVKIQVENKNINVPYNNTDKTVLKKDLSTT